MSSPFLGSYSVLMVDVALVIASACVWHRVRMTRTPTVPVRANAGDPACCGHEPVLKAGASCDRERQQ